MLAVGIPSWEVSQIVPYVEGYQAGTFRETVQMDHGQGEHTSLLPLPKPFITGPCSFIGNGGCGPFSGPA